MKRTSFLLRYPFLLLLLFLLAAYLPVFLPFFHIKNDTITQNLPVRTFISESLYSGYFPWWNPYINFGIPQYGDMNTGFWNPFCWLIAGTSGYGVWAITVEEMLCILIGGWGIYLLCKDHLRSPAVAIIAAMAYMTSGFITGHLQHFCWITGTAFFPYVLLFFFRVQHDPTVKNFILGGWCIFFFVASTHPGLIIGALYFLLFLLIALLCLRRDIRPAIDTRTTWTSGMLLLLSGLLLSIIVIVSDVDVLHNISRGSIVTLRQSLKAPTSFQSYLSLLFPLSVQKNDAFFHTDITMRNACISLLLFACLAVTAKRLSKKLLLGFGAILLFFILLSSGGPFKTFAYHFIPLTGNVRLNGEFNYFVVLMLLLAGAAGLEFGMSAPSGKEKVQRALYFLQWLFGISLAVSVIVLFLTRQSLLFAPPAEAENVKQSIKWVIDRLSFWDMILIQSVIQLVTLYLIRRYWNSRLMLIVGLHQALLCWCILPYTGLGMADKASRQALISQFPKGIHAPEQKALVSTVYLDSVHIPELGLMGAYSKKIGYLKHEAYPIELTRSIDFFHDTALVHFILAQSWLFLSKDTTAGTAASFDSAHIHIVKFGPGIVRAVIDNTDFHYLTFLQNDYPYWKASIDGRPVAHFTGFKTFVTLPLPPGRQDVEISFDPAPIRHTLWIQLLIALSTLLLLCSRQIRNIRLLRPRTIA
ncbi:MAG TPA: hypothetical protein VHD83_02515 [Puia sp.]|nr:hypothetical protein [Puia sp.]